MHISKNQWSKMNIQSWILSQSSETITPITTLNMNCRQARMQSRSKVMNHHLRVLICRGLKALALWTCLIYGPAEYIFPLTFWLQQVPLSPYSILWFQSSGQLFCDEFITILFWTESPST